MTSYKGIYNKNAVDCNLFLKDHLTLKTNVDNFNKNCDLIKICSINNQEYFSVLNPQKKCISFISFKKGKDCFQIQLPYDIDEIYDYKIENLNSIYLVLANNKIVICNKDKIEKEYTVNEMIPPLDHKYCLYSSGICPIEIYKDQIFVYNFPQERLDNPISRNKIFDSKRDIHLIKKNGKLEINNITGSYPREFKSNHYYNCFFPMRVFNKNSHKLVYSFYHSKNAEIVDSETNESLNIELDDAKLFAKNDTFPISKMHDMNFKNRYCTENDRFISMIYDKYNDKYIRVLSKGINYENSDGTINSPMDKPFYLLVYDKNFSLEKVIQFPPKKYYCLSIVPTVNGVLIPENTDGTGVKVLNYDLFKFY